MDLRHETLKGISRPDPSYDGLQIDTRKMRLGVLSGYILPFADRSNQPGQEFIERLQRSAIEMIRKNHDRGSIREVLAKVKGEFLCDLLEVESVLDWKQEDRDTFRLCHDVAFRICN